MKKKSVINMVLILLLFIIVLLKLLGVGYVSSGAAIHDLKEELQTLYGEEYTGREVDGATEDMAFVIKPKTWFMTNWNLRQAMALDYKYDCQVIFTRYEGKRVQTRSIHYQGIDPMGKEHTFDRAYLNLDSQVEK